MKEITGWVLDTPQMTYVKIGPSKRTNEPAEAVGNPNGLFDNEDGDQPGPPYQLRAVKPLVRILIAALACRTSGWARKSISQNLTMDRPTIRRQYAGLINILDKELFLLEFIPLLFATDRDRKKMASLCYRFDYAITCFASSSSVHSKFLRDKTSLKF
jgi:hypothetical protein